MQLPALFRRAASPVAPAPPAPTERAAEVMGGEERSLVFDRVLNAMADAENRQHGVLGLPAVEGGTALLSGVLASLRYQVCRPGPAGIMEPVPGHPVSRLLDRPSEFMTAFETIERCVADLIADGNAYLHILRDGRGAPRELVYHAPHSVNPERTAYAKIPVYRFADPDLGTDFLVSDLDCLHLRYRVGTGDRLRGVSPLKIGRHTLELAVESTSFARALMVNRGIPGAVITTAKPLQAKAKDHLRAQIARFFGGSGAGRVMVLEDGTAFTQLNALPRDAQLVELQEALVSAVARLLNIPDVLLSKGGGTNYAALKETIASWSRLGLRPWLSRLEGSFSDKLLSSDALAAGYRVKADTSELLRLDDGDRARVLVSLVGGGIVTPNEARQREGLPEIEGGSALVRTPGATVAAADTGRPPGSRDVASGDPTPGSTPGGEG